MQAKINGNRIECGKCGSLLAIIKRGVFVVPQPESEQQENALEIKCKHKSQGQYCDALNEVEL